MGDHNKVNPPNLEARIIKIVEKTVRNIFSSTTNITNVIGGASADVSTKPLSRNLLSKSGNTIEFAGNKVAVASRQNGLVLWDMPAGNLTNNLDPMTKNGSIATATITQVGGYDNVVVANGTIANNWFRVTERLWTAKPLRAHMRVKMITVGATAPTIGFSSLSVGGIYSNFNNPTFFIYINLLTGAIVNNNEAGWNVTATNGFSTPIANGETLDVYFEYHAFNKITLTVCRDNLAGEVSTYRLVNTGLGSGSERSDLLYLGTILNDGEFRILKHTISTGAYANAKVCLVGDSLLSGGRQAYASSIQYKLEQQMPYRVANLAAGTCMLAGMHAIMKDVMAVNPEVIFFDNGLDGMYNGYSNPASPNYAAWVAAFNRMVNTWISAGIEPILFIPSDNAYLYPDTTKQYIKDHWTINFPGRKYVETFQAEVAGKMDGTNFHYGPLANDVVVGKLLTELEALGKL